MTDYTDPERSPAEERKRMNRALTVPEWDILTGYRERIQLLHTVRMELTRAARYGWPVFDKPEQAHRLKMEINEFNTIMTRIPERRSRIVLRCRFALGFTIRDIADYMELSAGTVDNIIKNLKPE